MTDETLSAFLDGECTPDELERLLDAVERDPGLKQRFTRLSFARESGQGGRLGRADLGFADRVMAALDAQPAGQVLPFRSRRKWAWQPVVGLAAAAAVAAVAVLVVKPQDESLPVREVAQARAVLVAPPGEVEQVAAADRQWQHLDADASRQLNGYWMVYSQSRSQQGMGGTLGYARYAAYTADGKTQDTKP